MTPTQGDSQMPLDIRDEDLMRRFLVGDVTADERDRIEEAFPSDAEYFEELVAFESDMIAQYVRGDLPAAWRQRIDSTLAAYPARRRQIDACRALRGALDAPATEDRRVSWLGGRWVAAAAALAVIVASGWWLGSQRRVDTDPAARAPASPVVFQLAAGQTRSSDRQANVFRVPSGTGEVHLTLTLPATTPAVTATLRQVGGDTEQPLDTPQRAAVSSSEAALTWRVARSLLVRGDYLLTVTLDASPSARDVVASAFFSIVE